MSEAMTDLLITAPKGCQTQSLITIAFSWR
jgi:hypothetical protein